MIHLWQLICLAHRWGLAASNASFWRLRRTSLPCPLVGFVGLFFLGVAFHCEAVNTRSEFRHFCDPGIETAEEAIGSVACIQLCLELLFSRARRIVSLVAWSRQRCFLSGGPQLLLKGGLASCSLSCLLLVVFCFFKFGV